MTTFTYVPFFLLINLCVGWTLLNIRDRSVGWEQPEGVIHSWICLDETLACLQSSNLLNSKISLTANFFKDRSPFKIFSLRFSTKSVQAPSCERPKTAANTVSIILNQELFPNSGIATELYENMGKLACHVVNSNIAIDSLPMLQISLEIPALFRFMMVSWFLPLSQRSGRMYNTVVSINCVMWKVCRSPKL